MQQRRGKIQKTTYRMTEFMWLLEKARLSAGEQVSSGQEPGLGRADYRIVQGNLGSGV